VAVHQGVEAGAVVGHQQMAEFVHHHVFYAPVGQQQEIGAEIDAALFGVATPPPRLGAAVADGGRCEGRERGCG